MRQQLHMPSAVAADESILQMPASFTTISP